MIIAIVGGVGSGKTLSTVKNIVQFKGKEFTNFNLKGGIEYQRIKKTDLLRWDEKTKRYLGVNWKFWDDVRKKYKKFSIFFDEVDNMISARASMTKENRLMTQWISQIRKILSDDPDNHIYIITQTPRKIDINWRELTHIVIHCQKVEIKDKVWIIQRYYEGFDGFEAKRCISKRYFLGNPYFKYYNTHEMVRFSDAEMYL